MLGLRPPGLKFRIMCTEGGVISFILPQKAQLAQFSLYVHKSGLKPIHFTIFLAERNHPKHDILYLCWASVWDQDCPNIESSEIFTGRSEVSEEQSADYN